MLKCIFKFCLLNQVRKVTEVFLVPFDEKHICKQCIHTNMYIYTYL